MLIKTINKESPIQRYNQKPSFKLLYRYKAKNRRAPPIKIESIDDLIISKKNVDFVVLFKQKFYSITKVL